MLLSRKSFLTVIGASAGAVAFGVPGIALAQRAGYRWEIFNAGGVKWEIPSAWISNAEGNVLKTKPADGSSLRVEFIGISNPNADLGGIVRDELAKRMTNPKLIEAEKPIAQNGLSGSNIRGEGSGLQVPGALEFRAFVLRHNVSKKGVLAIATWKPGQYAQHQAYLEVTFGSIQPT
jgi:hypothetical protein